MGVKYLSTFLLDGRRHLSNEFSLTGTVPRADRDDQDQDHVGGDGMVAVPTQKPTRVVVDAWG